MSVPSDKYWTFDHPGGGRTDVDGVTWFACDPYPTWYRREGGQLIKAWQPDFGPSDEVRKPPLPGKLIFHPDPWADTTEEKS